MFDTQENREAFINETPEDAQGLQDSLASLLDNTLSAFEKACCVYFKAYEKGIVLTPEPFGAYRYFKEIAQGVLSAYAVFKVSGEDLKCLKGLDLKFQKRLADGEKVKVVTKKAYGQVTERKELSEMTMFEKRYAFDHETGLASTEEDQARFLSTVIVKKTDNSPEVKIKALPDEGKISVGRQKIDPEDLKEALLSLGFLIKPAYGRVGRPKKAA